ncbi:MAG: tetratricopeptide repeat protein [Trueperaceae bacterium]|nr:tetratricopeptide repeat protein [Trueperaceae bacterium]
MRPLITLLAVLALLGTASAQTVLVHPFDSGDSVLGAVVADRVAQSLAPQVDLMVGPAAAPTLVPPVPYDNGFLGPLAVLRQGGVATLHGAALLRSGTGADLAASGRVATDAEGLRLELFAAAGRRDALQTTVRAPEDRPDLLARRAARLLASHLGVPAPSAPDAIDMAGADDALGRASTLLAGGFAQEAEQLFREAEEAGQDTPRLRALRAALEDVQDGRSHPDDPALAASLALTVLEDDARTLAYMERLGEAGLPAADAWIGAIAASTNDLARADDAYMRAAEAYPYGRAARAAYQASQGRSGAAEAVRDLHDGGDVASLVLASLLHELSGDAQAKRAALEALGRAAPTFAWPFEQLSFLAFDRDDGRAAAEALVVAVRLAPEEDLYWTNLGWAWYLLGFWERSEEASTRALELEPGAHIAAYNLGLVRARSGRLDEAMSAYDTALDADPEVDDEALADVRRALEEVPDEPALHYVLGRMLEAEGDRDAAAQAFDRYLELGGFGAPYDARAEARYEALSAPPPPLAITDDAVTARLGGTRPAEPWHPGDPIGLSFEVTTPGESLPRTLRVRAEVRPGQGEEPILSEETSVEIPAEAIGYVVEELAFELPDTLEAGTYTAEVRVRGDGEQRATARVALPVEGQPVTLRRLIGRGVVLTSLDAGRSLFGASDLGREEAVVATLVDALRQAADAAEEALPAVEEGRFAGLSGRALFEQSDEGDVRAFLDYLVREEVRDVRLTFVDAYAEWAIAGAPGP